MSRRELLSVVALLLEVTEAEVRELFGEVEGDALMERGAKLLKSADPPADEVCADATGRPP